MNCGGGLRHGSIAAAPRPNPLTRFLPFRVTILACSGGGRSRALLPNQTTPLSRNTHCIVTTRSEAAEAASEGRKPSGFRFHDSGDSHDRSLSNPQDDRDGTTAARR